MVTVFIACAGGATSGLLISKVKEAAEKIGLRMEMDFGAVMVDPDWKNKYKDIDLLIIYGWESNIEEHSIESYDKAFNLLLISPQVRYLKMRLDAFVKKGMLNIPYKLVESTDFGRMNGENVLRAIMEATGLQEKKVDG